MLRPRRPRSIVLAILVGALTVGTSAGCGSSAKPRVAEVGTLTTSSPSSISASKVSSEITGIGATQTAWDANHSPHSDLGGWAGPRVGLNAEWSGVKIQHGHVISYFLSLPSRTNQSAAITRVLQEFPSDAVASPPMNVTDAAGETCVALRVTSRALTTPLRDAGGTADGSVSVVLTGPASANGAQPYDPTNVEGAVLNAEDATGAQIALQQACQ